MTPRRAWRRLCWALLVLWGLQGVGTGTLQASGPVWPGTALADDRDDPDDDGDESDDEDEDDAAAPPASLATLGRQLNPGSLWVERGVSGVISVRLAVEWRGSTVASITLDPTTFEPVEASRRGLARPRAVPAPDVLRAARSRLSAAWPARLTSGRYAVTGARGALLPLYWNGRHVADVVLDARGQPRRDEVARRALLESSIRVR